MGRGNHESIKEFNLFLSFFSSQRLLESSDAHSTQDAIPEGASFLVSGLRSEYSSSSIGSSCALCSACRAAYQKHARGPYVFTR